MCCFESRVRFRYSFPRYQKRGSFIGLKSTNQLSAQWCIVPRSELRLSAAVLGFSTIIYRLVSSAKRRMFDWMFFEYVIDKDKKKQWSQN